MLENIRIVLVNTSHPGNIGATARAMKTMGLSRLYLVAPKSFPDLNASAMAAGAEDLLDSVVLSNSLAEALLGTTLVVGTSARDRWINWPYIAAKDCGSRIIAESTSGGEIAVVFGRESSGLSNIELQLCHLHLHIPTNSEYGSLNLASAVQIVAYEIRLAYLTALEAVNNSKAKTTTIDTVNTILTPKAEEFSLYIDRLESLLTKIGMINEHNSRALLVARLRRIYLRANLDSNELNMLQGIISAIFKKLDAK